MTKKEIGLRMKLIDDVTKTINTIDGRMTKFEKSFSKNWMKGAAAVLGTTYALKKMADMGLATGGALITTSSTVEQLKVRLEGLLGSVEEGNKLFDLMSDYAGEVPKTYEEIMASATDLAAVVKGGADEVASLMPIIVDIAAGTGMQVREVTGQMIRMYSAGAAAADMFRERGVSAALGFQAKVSYTSEETMKRITEIWESGHGKYVGAAQRLAETYEGAMSMIMDNWFKFKVQVGEPIFEDVKDDLNAFLSLIQESKKEGGEYNKVVAELRDFFKEAYGTGKDFAALLLVSGGQAVDTWNELSVILKGAQAAWVGMIGGIMEASLALGKIPGIGEKIVDKEALEAGLEAVQEDLARLNNEIIKGRERADVDYSQRLQKQLDKLRGILDQKKQEIEKHEEDKRAVEDESEQVSYERFLACQEKRVEKMREIWAAWQDEKTQAQLVALQQEAEQYRFYLDTVRKANQSTYVLLRQMKNTAISGVSTALSQLSKGTGDAKKSAEELGQALLDMLIRFGVQKVVNFAISKTLLAAETTASVTAAEAIAAAWAPAAANVSLASFGTNSGPAVAGIIAAHAASAAPSLPGLVEGGDIERGGRVIVGERGPELLDLPTGARVTPLEKAGPSGGLTIQGDFNIYISMEKPGGNPRDIGEAIGYQIEEALRGAVSVT